MEAVIGFGDGLNEGCKRRVKNISHTSNQNCWLGDGTNRDGIQRRHWRVDMGRRYGRLGFESVGFEGLLGFESGAQEGHHLINGTDLVGGELCVKGKESNSGEKVGEGKLLRPG